MTGPVYIGGAERSGKTLMRWLLSSHPRIVVSRRTEMWSRFYGRFGDLTDPQAFERCVRAMLERKQIADLEPDMDRLRREFRSGERTYPRLFALIHEQYAERSGKARWGDQSGMIERFAAEIVSAHPDARLIQMVRDPRDRYEALLRRRLRGPGGVGKATALWIRSADLGTTNARRHPDSYRIVRYEDLVGRPHETMREVFSFLGEDFDPAILRMDGVERYRAERSAAEDGIPISSAHVGRYRGGVDRVDLAFIQAFAARPMAGFGYAPDPLRLRVGERLRGVTLRWPLALARMGVWRALEALGTRSAAPGPRHRVVAT